MRRREIVAQVPNEVWESLTPDEQRIFFHVEDCAQGRFSTVELRRRLDEMERLRINWFLHDHGLPMVAA